MKHGELRVNNEKIDSVLNLALETAPAVRRKSDILSNGYDMKDGLWEVIVKYHGDILWLKEEVETLELLLNGYAIMRLSEKQLERIIQEEQIEYVEKPKNFAFDGYREKQQSCILPVSIGPMGLNGEGVLVAVLDSGIDYLLDDFQDENGSRILYLWDQTLLSDEERMHYEWLSPEERVDMLANFCESTVYLLGIPFTGRQVVAMVRAAEQMYDAYDMSAGAYCALYILAYGYFNSEYYTGYGKPVNYSNFETVVDAFSRPNFREYYFSSQALDDLEHYRNIMCALSGADLDLTSETAFSDQYDYLQSGGNSGGGEFIFNGASGTCGDNLTWNLGGDGMMTISGTGGMDFPSGIPWESYRNRIQTLIVEEGVTSIANWAFEWCASLTSVELPDSLTSLGGGAFSGCTSLTSVELPDSLISLGDFAFAECSSLTSVELPEGLISLGEGAFGGCTSLTSVELPDSLTSIGRGAFSFCTSLISVELPDNLTSLGDSVFYECTSLNAVELPDSLTSIGSDAFSYCTSLTSVELPEGLTSIGYYAFSGSALAEVTFTGNVPAVGTNAFAYVTATCYYPADKEGWTEDVLQDYGNGTLTWVAYCTEHTSGEAVKENETADSYESVVYCSVCGAELSREVVSTGPVEDSNLKIANVGLSLQDYIGVQVAVRKADINGGVYDRAYLTFTQTSPEGEVTTGTSEFNLALGIYVGAEVPVMAWSMSDEVTATVYYTVGGVTYVGESRTTSVRDQAMTRINTTSTSSSVVKTRGVCVAMLNYGAAVQTAFNHCSSNAEYLANYYLTADQKALPEVEFGGSVTLPSGSLKPARGALSFGAKVMMQFPIKNADLSNYVVRYSIDGGAEITVPKEDIMTQGSYVGPSIAAKPLYMRSEYRIAIYDATTGEKVYGDIVCSISALAAAHEGGAYHNVAVTMMAYGDAVAAL